MSTNDFLAFATDGGANVETQPDYLADASRGTGEVDGTANAPRANKVWRQSSFMAAVLATFTNQQLDSDVLDDGDVAGKVLLLGKAAQGYTAQVAIATAVARKNAATMYIATAAVAFTIAYSTTLTPYWQIAIFARSGNSTIAIDGADSINGGGAGVGATVQQGMLALLRTDGAGNLHLTMMPALGVASNAQVLAAADVSRPITPSNAQYHPSALKAAATFNGVTPALLKNYNLSTFSRISTGLYELTFDNNMADADYFITFGAMQGANRIIALVDDATPPSVSKFRVVTTRNDTGAVQDSPRVSVCVHGTLA